MPKENKTKKKYISNTHYDTKCDICNLDFETKEECNDHKEDIHEDGKYKCCSYCKFKTNGWVKLKVTQSQNQTRF